MTIATLYTIHAADQSKVDAVAAEMQSLGAPTIRVVDCGDYYQAIEGVHRIAAAAKLGLPITLQVLAQDDLVASDSLDWQDLQPGEQYSAGELAGEAYSPSSGAYKVNDDGVWEAV